MIQLSQLKVRPIVAASPDDAFAAFAVLAKTEEPDWKLAFANLYCAYEQAKAELAHAQEEFVRPYAKEIEDLRQLTARRTMELQIEFTTDGPQTFKFWDGFNFTREHSTLEGAKQELLRNVLQVERRSRNPVPVEADLTRIESLLGEEADQRPTMQEVVNG